MSVADALLHLVAGDRRAAVASCVAATDASPLAGWLHGAIDQRASGDVYVDPEAFERFISGGSNVGLYAATIEVLAELNEQQGAHSMLDIGCGDGRVTVATVPSSCRQVQLLEPSAALLQTAVDRLGNTVSIVESTPATLQDLLAGASERRWDAVQSTFALHNLPPHARADALDTLASRTDSIAIVEFDVPRFVDRSREHAVYAADAYEAGIAEYETDPTVITGFLLPVLVGQFAPDQPRHTYEQPAAAWGQELSRAGFRSVTMTPVAEFWWADAWLIHGTNVDSIDSIDSAASAVVSDP